MLTVWGVFAWTKNYGYTTERIGEGFSIEEDNLPLFIGPTPVGKSNWYKKPPYEKLLTDEETDWYLCPMRGSKRGISARYGEGYVHDYSYAMAQLLGVKFGKFSKRTGNRFLVLNTSHDSLGQHHHGVEAKIKRSFIAGVSEGLCGNTCGKSDVEIIQSRESWKENSSSLVALNLNDLDKEKKKALIDLAYQVIDEYKPKVIQ